MAVVLRRLGRIWQAYERVLREKPIATQMATSTVLWSLGDVIAQKIDKRSELDVRHTLLSGVYGGVMMGTLGHIWYQNLDSVVARTGLARASPAFIAAKVGADEAVFGPLHVAGFYAFVTAGEGGSWQDVKDKLRRDFVSSYLAELAFWPAFQVVNFWKVPVRHQLLAVNLACLLDATFLCWVSSQEDWTQVLPFLRDRSSSGTATQPEPART